LGVDTVTWTVDSGTDAMTPMIEHYHLLITLYWLAMFPIATFILVYVTVYVTGESPQTLMRAALTTLLVAVSVFLTYDVSGYLLARMMQDASAGIRFPLHYSYWDWLREPLALKWYVLSFVPIIRFLPVLFALCIGGMVQVFLWKIPYHLGIVVFLTQVFLDLLAMLLLSFFFSLGIGVYERTVLRTGPARAAEPFRGTTPGAAPSNLQHLRQLVENLRPEEGSLWRRLDARWQSVNRYCQPVYDFLQPVTKHLPPPVQDFLNGGGWIVVLGGLVVLAFNAPRIHRGRKHYKRRHPEHHAVATSGPRDQLDLIGEALTGLGPRQVMVNGLPSRLRLVVVAPAGAGSGTPSADAIAQLLDSVFPGLSEIVAFDFPRVECWSDRHARDSFRTTLVEGVKVPEPPETPSRWLLLAGEATAPQGSVHLGLAVMTDRPTTTRLIDVAPGQWATVVGMRDVPKSQQDR
jgi:hypothetical protein